MKAGRRGVRTDRWWGRGAWMLWMAVPFGVVAPPLSAQMTTRDLLALPRPAADRRIAYGDDSLQFGDLRVPDGPGPHPVLVVIHGGCWSARFNLDHLDLFLDAFRREGVASWSIEYRRVGDGGGGWPGTFDDVARGVDYVRTLARDHSLDLGRAVILGHSAGGHLALWTAARTGLPAEHRWHPEQPVPWRGVVSLAGVGDLAAALEDGICGTIIERLMGGTPETTPNRYTLVSPVERIPLGVRQMLISGALDGIVPVGGVRAYAETARAAGDTVRVVVVPGAGHFEVVTPTTGAWPAVRDAVRALIGN